MSPLKLCLLSAEIVPFAKTGGLADVAGALLQYLRAVGHEIRAFMPLYTTVARKYPDLAPVASVQQVSLSLGGMEYRYSLQIAHFPNTDIPVYFVDCPAMYDRGALYTLESDEHSRFLLLTRAALESCRRLEFAPQVFHCNDWHTALLPLILKTQYGSDPVLGSAKSLLTIHNIGYQGIFPASAAADIGIGSAWSQLDQADMSQGVINPLKAGIKFADRVSTVSPTYAREICDSALGMGLEGALCARPDRVAGILNGVDYQEWDPAHDVHLRAQFSARDLRGKAVNKRSLLERAKLDVPADRLLIGMVTRLAEQKGIDLLIDSLPALLQERDFGLVVLGSGDTRYANFFSDLAQRFAGRVSYRVGFDEPFAHLIEAGSDAFLMPSRYEPCGLNQMYSLRYGTIPIVRNTGGLADSVEHFDPSTGKGTGCVFNDYDAPAVRWAVDTVLGWYGDSAGWLTLMRNAMAKDFSWQRQIAHYESLYAGMLGLGRGPQ